MPVSDTTSFSSRVPSIPVATRESMVSAPAGPRVVMTCMTLIILPFKFVAAAHLAGEARFPLSHRAPDRPDSRTLPRRPGPSSTRRSFFLLAARLPSPTTAWLFDFSRRLSCSRRGPENLAAAPENLPSHLQTGPERHPRRCSRPADPRPWLPSRRAGCLRSQNSAQKHPLLPTLLEYQSAARGNELGRPNGDS